MTYDIQNTLVKNIDFKDAKAVEI